MKVWPSLAAESCCRGAIIIGKAEQTLLLTSWNSVPRKHVCVWCRHKQREQPGTFAKKMASTLSRSTQHMCWDPSPAADWMHNPSKTSLYAPRRAPSSLVHAYPAWTGLTNPQRLQTHYCIGIIAFLRTSGRSWQCRVACALGTSQGHIAPGRNSGGALGSADAHHGDIWTAILSTLSSNASSDLICLTKRSASHADQEAAATISKAWLGESLHTDLAKLPSSEF